MTNIFPKHGNLERPGEHEWSLTGPVFIELLQAMLAKGAQFRFQARGFSMDPFIRDGDVITISPLGKDSPSVGDVVAFIQREIEKLLIHRVIRIEGNSYFMKGDNTGGGDSPVPGASLLGSVTKVERGHKRVSIGLGPEKFLIALLTRKELMIPLVRFAVKLRGSIHNTMMVLFVPFQGRGQS